MNEVSSINAKIQVPGKVDSPGVKRPLTLRTISDWIRMQGMDEYTTEGLIELASKYPEPALPSFRKNFNLMIQRVRQKRKQELGGEPLQEEIQNAESQSEVGTNTTGQSFESEVTDNGDGDGAIEYA